MTIRLNPIRDIATAHLTRGHLGKVGRYRTAKRQRSVVWLPFPQFGL